MKLRIACLVVGFLSLVQLTVAQTSTQTASALPRLVRFGGTVKDLNGNPLTGVVGITFALHSEQTGGAPLWLETQNVTADSNGHYTALLGSTKPDGLPAELFTSEQARWVGVQVSGQAEQPRVLLVSAPYALKAGDAETIGGLPPSAFVLAAPPVGGSAAESSPAASTAESISPATTSDVTTTGGTLNTIPLFTTATNIQNSILTQTAATAVNVGGTLSLPPVGTASATAGKNSQALTLAASAYNTGTGTAAAQNFRLQAEPVGNDTSSTSGTLNLLYASGANTPAETGLHIASNGLITFAAGQTLPKVSGNETVSGTVTAMSFSGNGAAVTDVNAIQLGGLASSSFAQLAASHTADFIPLWSSSTGDLGNSVLFQSGSGSTAKVGINSTTPATTLDVNGATTVRGAFSLPAQGAGATATAGTISHTLNLAASAFNSGTGKAVNQTFRWQAEPAGNDTSSPSGTLNLLFAQGTSAFAETGLNIASNGVINFAAGQPITVSGNMSASQLISTVATGTAPLQVSSSTQVPNLNASLLGGLPAGAFAQIAAANTFTGNQTVNGSVSATGLVSGSSFGLANSCSGINCNLFAFGSYTNHNAFLGFAALQAPAFGGSNTGVGVFALEFNNGGSYNTASGNYALFENETGSNNTAVGYSALGGNNSGSDNTAVGYSADQANYQGCCGTAIGFQAMYNNEEDVGAVGGNYNTGVGYEALYSGTSGSENTAVGTYAGYTNTGTGNTCVGYGCGGGTTASNLHNATAIGAHATVSVSDAVVLGSIAGVNGATATARVGIGTTSPTNLLTLGQGAGPSIADGWATYSSRRWKTNIQPLHNALGMVEQLRGVSYDLKDSGKHEIGVIAEEVGAVVPEVVSYEENGKDARGLDYSRLTALLIEATKEQQREFRQEQADLAKALRQIKQQQSLLRAQRSAMRSLEAEVREDRETLRKVKAQVAASQPTVVAAK